MKCWNHLFHTGMRSLQTAKYWSMCTVQWEHHDCKMMQENFYSREVVRSAQLSWARSSEASERQDWEYQPTCLFPLHLEYGLGCMRVQNVWTGQVLWTRSSSYIHAYLVSIIMVTKSTFSCKGKVGAYVVRVGGKKGSCNVFLVPLGRATSDENIWFSLVLFCGELKQILSI